MSPFRPNQSEHITGQDLLALHLNELPGARAAAVRQIVAGDPALAAESASISSALAAVRLTAASRNPLQLDSAFLERSWQVIRPQLHVYSPASGRWRRPLFAAGLLAATAAGVVFLIHTRPTAQPQTPSQAVNQESNSPTLAANPNLGTSLQADLQPGPRPAQSTPSFSTGVYRSTPRNPDAPIHFISPSSQPNPGLNSPANQPANQLAITAAPSQPLTLEPQPSISANPAPNPFPLQVYPQQTANQSMAIIVPIKSRRSHPFDIMFGLGGAFIPEQGSGTGSAVPTTVTVNRAAVGIVSFHQRFRPALGYRATLSYTRQNFTYSYAPTGSLTTSANADNAVNSRLFESAGTYVLQGPHSGRLTTTVDAGAALLAFLPIDSPDPRVSYSFRGAAIVGVNLDYAITKHVGARLGYRAQIYKSPGFGNATGSVPVATPAIVDNEPSLGVTYTFGKP